MNSSKPTLADKTKVFQLRRAGLTTDTGIMMRPADADWTKIKPLEVQPARPKPVATDVAVWMLC